MINLLQFTVILLSTNIRESNTFLYIDNNKNTEHVFDYTNNNIFTNIGNKLHDHNIVLAVHVRIYL